jgi:cytochrome P450
VLQRLLEPSFGPKFVTSYLTIIDETTKEDINTWSATGDYMSSDESKTHALRLFYKSVFGRTAGEVLEVAGKLAVSPHRKKG